MLAGMNEFAQMPRTISSRHEQAAIRLGSRKPQQSGLSKVPAFLRPAIVFTALAVPICAEQPAGEKADVAAGEFFEKRIRPLLVDHCYECHSAKADTPEGGLRLDSRAGLLRGGDSGPAIVPGRADESELILAVRYDAEGYKMPPDGKLSDQQIADLTRWVATGAIWPGSSAGAVTQNKVDKTTLMARASHWSFQPVQHHTPPSVEGFDWPRTPIDHFILRRLEEAGLGPAPVVGKHVWLRRVYFVLVGLPPAPEAIDRFLRDQSPDAYQKVVDGLLASPHYGERWGRHWLDLVRFAETAGNEFDYEIPFAWRYRDYVIRALNADVPYDDFVREHIAGDLLSHPRRDAATGLNESTLGTGFYWFGPAMQSPIDVLGEQFDTIENQIDVMCKAFLGLTVACARCHDHKFDPISTRDYYALVGYLRSSRRDYAFTDDRATTEAFISQIQSLDGAHRPPVMRHGQQQIRSRVKGFAETLLQADDSPRLSELIDEASANPSDLLYPWAQLAAAKHAGTFATARERLIGQLERAQATGGITFEEFGRDYFDRWSVSGYAFRQHDLHRLGLFVDTNSPFLTRRLIAPGTAHSGHVHGRLRGALRSPTFTIDKKFIDYRMSRVDGANKVERIDPADIKKGQVHLILDGLHLIRHPIYHGLTIDVKPGRSARWYRQDVSKWIGHRAYIEITDENEGVIDVERIVFSDDESPPRSRNRLFMEMLRAPTLNSRKALAEGYQRLLVDSLNCWEQGRLGDGETRMQRIEIINWFLDLQHSVSSPEFSESESPNPDLTAYLDHRDRLAARVATPARGLAMTDGTGEDAYLLVRGNHERPSEPVPRRFLEVLGGLDGGLDGGQGGEEQASTSGRIELAERMIDETNPLFARVIVNRIWQHHFGRGLVPTADDFGVMGQPPSHPQLLDYLATELIRSGWSLKHIHRMLSLSSAVRMSSTIDEQIQARDPENKLLHRMPVRRLEGEAIRDAMLSVSGRFDRRMFGPGVLPHLTPFMEGRGRPEQSGPRDGDGRRSVYINVRRNFLTPMFVVFDYPAPQSTSGRRSVSNVPAQALTMMNNPFFVEQSRLWAEGLLEQHGSSTESAIEQLYLSAFGRLPSDGEVKEAISFLQQQRDQDRAEEPDIRAWTDLCHVLVNSREFIFVR